MTKRRLPIGLQTFRELREEECYYVDKTGFIARLLDEGKHYFLSRPRRFGKSLFLDTLKEAVRGGAALAQLREPGYADKYRASGDPIHLIGVEFSKSTRNVTAFAVEQA